MIEGLAYPPTVFIDTLNVCNARCPFCPLFQGDSQFDRELRPAHIMTMDLYEKLLNEVVSWQPLPASLIHSGTGDILYDPKVVQRLQLLKKYDLAKITTLMTNAQHLGEAVASEIVEAGVAQVIIGFDGASKEVYEAHRVRCQYARVLENIKKFVEIRDRNCGSTSIWIKYVRTPQNQHEVEQAFELFSKIMNHSIDRFQDALSVDWADDDQSESGVYLRPKVYGGELRSEGCSYLEDVIQVNSDGIVSACCWDYNLTISDGGLGRAPRIPRCTTSGTARSEQHCGRRTKAVSFLRNARRASSCTNRAR